MQVQKIIHTKGGGVITTTPDATVAEAANLLKEHRIGAVVVVGPTGAVVGILSERDIVRGLPQHGTSLLVMSVGDLMTRAVMTCTTHSHVEDVMRDMTAGRFRHIPVVEAGRLIGIVSIGDMVKQRLEQLETETEQLQTYIQS
jgi:CBS domain-containing protein